jgi:hypothetical protein
MSRNKIGAAVLMAALPLAALTTTAAAAAAAPASAQAHAVRQTRTVVHCTGGATSCTARVSLAGGASNERVVIQLPSTGLRLKSARPTSARLDGSYLISDQSSIAGGHKYAFTLSAAEAPRGSALKLHFTRPGTSTPHIVRCSGSASLCHAKIPIGGGASNRKVVVQLPGTDLGLVAVQPSSRDLRGAYSMSRQHLRSGDTEFAFVLSAVQGAPRGSHLTLTFASQ